MTQAVEYSDSLKPSIDSKRNINDLSYAADDWFVTGAAEVRLVRDGSVQPQMQWSATVAGETWVLLYNGAFWRFGVRGATAEDEESGADATSLTFNIDGDMYNLSKGTRLALVGDIPQADSSSIPQMDSQSGSAGGAQTTTYSKSDHSHPSDTSKLDAAAAYEAWAPGITYPAGAVVSHSGLLWRVKELNTLVEPSYESPDWEMTTIYSLKQDALSSQQIDYINAVPGKADKVANVTAGNLAALDSQGNLEDSGAKPSDFALADDLSYQLVTPGEWKFSGSEYDPSNHTYSVNIEEIGSEYEYQLLIDGTVEDYAQEATDDLLSVSFNLVGITAARVSLPGHLCDHAVNTVNISATTILTLPASQYKDKARNLYVNFNIQNST